MHDSHGGQSCGNEVNTVTRDELDRSPTGTATVRLIAAAAFATATQRDELCGAIGLPRGPHFQAGKPHATSSPTRPKTTPTQSIAIKQELRISVETLTCEKRSRLPSTTTSASASKRARAVHPGIGRRVERTSHVDIIARDERDRQCASDSSIVECPRPGQHHAYGRATRLQYHRVGYRDECPSRGNGAGVGIDH
jgi:hypothetical protein